MSQENVEHLRAWAAAWEMKAGQGALVDRTTGEPVLSHLDPEVTYEDMSLPDHMGETYHGHDGVIRATERWVETYDEIQVDLERIVGSGACLVSIHRFRATAQHTGIEFEEPLAIVGISETGKSFVSGPSTAICCRLLWSAASTALPREGYWGSDLAGDREAQRGRLRPTSRPRPSRD